HSLLAAPAVHRRCGGSALEAGAAKPLGPQTLGKGHVPGRNLLYPGVALLGTVRRLVFIDQKRIFHRKLRSDGAAQCVASLWRRPGGRVNDNTRRSRGSRGPASSRGRGSRQGRESGALFGDRAPLTHDDRGGLVRIGRGFRSAVPRDSGGHVTGKVGVSRARGIADDFHRLGRDVLTFPPQADPASLGTAADQIFRRQTAHAIDDLRSVRGAPESLLILAACGDHRGESLKRADPFPSLRLAVPKPPAEVAIEDDAAVVAVPIHPAAEMLEARAGAEGKGDPG